jgi:D-3-phosphoglycerate dehydrogenase / 2-oxoglutarate reductase
LHDIDSLQITPRVAATTRESRIRSAWAVARRIDELLTASGGPQRAEFKPTVPDVPLDLPADEASG